MDYTIISETIRQTLEKAECPLTDDQFILMSGNLAAFQQMIESMGLKEAIEVIEPMAKHPSQR